jgi:ATP-dependent Lon protease
VSAEARAEVPRRPKYRSAAEERDEIGLTNGLAVTMVGGDLLPTEVTVMPGKGKLLTRQARRGDAGVGAGGDELRALRAEHCSA